MNGVSCDVSGKQWDLVGCILESEQADVEGLQQNVVYL